ncbi:MAG: hypothetical protein A2134_00275 [Candidatus Woykebacteria bacterium RBG_16_39_9b]|uniref:Glycosyl transferase family 1 domain-containing protein n=1 Tax=Candidatus Woykebacteria bacterium RBG_16_39_9b TaxID=1802595 RepID=A0A1G1WDS1_9BACT|nr:MAG: hypothetical protein A2134_00275 [Candidatus Woykebacteria bacterium RBG_16_39_9b]
MYIGIDASRITAEEKTGTESYSFNLINALQIVDNKNKYTLYLNKPHKYFEPTAKNFTVKYIPFPRLWTQGRLALECLMNPPDVLFVPAHTIPVIRRPSLKTVVTIHDLGAEFLEQYHKFPQKLYLNWSTNYVAKYATHIIAVSESTKNDLIKMFALESSRISVVHEGVNRRYFSRRGEGKVGQIKKKYGLENYLLFVGTIQPRKNLVNLIEAFSKIRLKDIDLVLVGKPGWLYDEIYKAPKKFGVEDRVKFLGYVPINELPALYSGASGLALVSLYEGFGLPVLEAMAAGCPCLVSNQSSLPEVAGDAALTVDPDDENDIKRGIEELLEDQKTRQELIERGLNRVKKFTWEKAAEKTLAVLEKVNNENPRY